MTIKIASDNDCSFIMFKFLLLFMTPVVTTAID
jgi:hypothetical protein